MEEGRNRTILQWLAPLVCAIIVIAVMMLKFFVDVKRDATQTAEKELAETIENYALKITNDLESICASGRTIAQVIRQQSSAKPEMIQQLLEAQVEQTEVYEAVYCSREGILTDQSGGTIQLSEEVYEKATEPASKILYFYQEEDEISGASAILVMIPISEDKGNLLLFYPMNRIGNLIKVKKEFGQTAFVVVTDKEGNVFSYGSMDSHFLENGNVWKGLDKKFQNAGMHAKLKMQNGNTGSVELSAGGEKRTLAFTPIGINDWNLIIGIDQGYVKTSQTRMWRKVFTMMLQLLGVVAAFSLFFVMKNVIDKKRNVEKSKTLQEKADTDLLTGLNNKLATERKIKEYIKNYPDSLAMMFVLDIDNFKKINDTLGHAFGDEVLRTLGKRIGVNFRVTDIIGRTGGDEFTIFLKDLKEDANTLKEARKLVKFFADFQAGEYVKYSATASIGAAVFPTHGSDFESLYKAADQALYKAKERGKNQLAFYDDRDRAE